MGQQRLQQWPARSQKKHQAPAPRDMGDHNSQKNKQTKN